MRRTVVFLFLLSIVGCTTGADEVEETAHSSGLTRVQPGSLSFFACSNDDKIGRSFTAMSASGQTVVGVVCCGILKGCTVRW